MILRGLAIAERLRSNNIPHTVRGEQGRARQLLLGVSGDVAAHNSQAHGETQTLQRAQPESYQSAPFVGVWKTDKETCTNDADAVGDDHGDEAYVTEARAYEATGQRADDVDSTSWYLQVLRTQR